ITSLGAYFPPNGRMRNTARAPFVLISGTLDRFPMAHLLCDQLGAFSVVTSIQDAQVLGIGAQIRTGRPLVDFGLSVRARYPVPRRAIGGLESDLCRPVQLGRVRVPRPFAFPIVEDAGRVFPLLRRLALVSR